MFKVGQLVRSNISGRIGVVVRANKDIFTVRAESFPDMGQVYPSLPQDDKYTSLIGNNYRSKQ